MLRTLNLWKIVIYGVIAGILPAGVAIRRHNMPPGNFDRFSISSRADARIVRQSTTSQKEIKWVDKKTILNLIDGFNTTDSDAQGLSIPNDRASNWILDNAPLLDCPDKDILQTYYFRWWVYRKHLKSTPAGWVVTEFLPDEPWAGKFNTISCAAGHHFMEGRWISNPAYLDDYSRFWFRGGGEPRKYSFWAADAIWQRALVTGKMNLAAQLLPDLVKNYDAWQKEHQDANGLFWQIDDRDGMEYSIGGSGYRPTINSYIAADARAIANIAAFAGKPEIATRFMNEYKARQKSLSALWDSNAQFYKVLPRAPGARLADVRELIGYSPWYFGLADASKASAWMQVKDPQGFAGKHGLTTAEIRNPGFMREHAHECLWNGPVWPYSTSITLTAMANLLNGPEQPYVTAADYYHNLQIYAQSQRIILPDGGTRPWIDEDMDANTGTWIARDILLNRGIKDRGKDYNHSTFCDLVISGLLGIRPSSGHTLTINPLVPKNAWSYFALESVPYHGHSVTVRYDKDGMHYGREKGLYIFLDGKLVAHADRLTAVRFDLDSP